MASYPCPTCGTHGLHRSRGAPLLRAPLRLFGLHRYRCHGCGRVEWHADRVQVVRPGTSRKRFVAMALLVLAFGALAGLGVIYLAVP